MGAVRRWGARISEARACAINFSVKHYVHCAIAVHHRVAPSRAPPCSVSYRRRSHCRRMGHRHAEQVGWLHIVSKCACAWWVAGGGCKSCEEIPLRGGCSIVRTLGD